LRRQDKRSAAGKEELFTAKLSRFILQSNKISGDRPNHRAFMPPPDLELSTFNIDDLSDRDIWRIGDAVRAEQHKENLYGRADLLAKSVYDVKLRAVRDDRPPRHVVVVGWPDDKAQQKNRAQLLAAASSYVPR
jgi:hypothetical protein